MKQQETLCWRCRNVGKRLCPWDDSKGETPTPGWTAIPQDLRVDKRTVQSYTVIKCPLADLEKSGVEHGNGVRKYAKADHDLIRELTDQGMTVIEIATMLDVSETTVAKSRSRNRKKEKEK